MVSDVVRLAGVMFFARSTDLEQVVKPSLEMKG